MELEHAGKKYYISFRHNYSCPTVQDFVSFKTRDDRHDPYFKWGTSYVAHLLNAGDVRDLFFGDLREFLRRGVGKKIESTDCFIEVHNGDWPPEYECFGKAYRHSSDNPNKAIGRFVAFDKAVVGIEDEVVRAVVIDLFYAQDRRAHWAKVECETEKSKTALNVALAEYIEEVAE